MKRPFETITTHEQFLSRKPCGANKAPLGWYKSELEAFCVKNNVPGYNSSNTLPQLCELISRYFDPEPHVPPVTIEGRICDSDARTKCDAAHWCMKDLRELCTKHGIPFTAQNTKQELCAKASMYFFEQSLQKLKLEPDNADPPNDEELKKNCNKQKIEIDPKWTRAQLLQHCWEKREILIERRYSLGHKESFHGKLDQNVHDLVGNVCGMLFLLSTYRSILCLPLKPQDLLDPTFGQQFYCDYQLCWQYVTYNNGEVAFDMGWIHNNTEKDLWNVILQHCNAQNKKRFVLLPLYLAATAANNKTFYHQNFIIVDNKEKTVERFDPLGAIVAEQNGGLYGEDVLNKLLTTSAKLRKYKYLPPFEICPRIGPQELEKIQKDIPRRSGDPAGFCTFWSLWYADRRLKYPNVKPKVLMEQILDDFQKSKIKLRNFIRNYANFYFQERKRMLKAAREKQRNSGWSDERVLNEVLLQELIKE